MTTDDAAPNELPELDPLVDTVARQIEAGVSQDFPYGRPGQPLDRRSPFRLGFTAALGVALAYVLLQAIAAVQQVLVLIVVSLFLAIGLSPAVDYLVRRSWRRGVAVGAVAALMLLTFGGFVAAAVPPITQQAQQLVKNLPSELDTLKKNPTLRKLDEKYHFIETIQRQTKDGPTLGLRALGGVVGVSKAVLGALFTTLTILTLVMYFLANLPEMKRSSLRLVPRSRRARVGLIVDEVLSRVGGYVLGNLATSVVAGLTSLLYLYFVDVPYPVALAIVVALTDLIPLVGATIGSVLVTAVAFLVSVPVGLATILFFVVYQLFENYLLVPRVMMRTVSVSPIVTIVAALIGGSLLGLVGALLAIPVAAAVQLVLAEVAYPRQDMA